MTARTVLACLIAGLVWIWGMGDVRAQRSGQTPAALEDVGLEEHLGESVPLDLTFRDESGSKVQLAEYFDGTRPVVLTMTYHNCPMLCNLILDGFTRTLQDFAWTPGDEFEVVSVSFAADETPELAAQQKRRYIRDLGDERAADGWHFLTGDEESIQALAASIGFQFRWMEDRQEYAHPAVLTFLSGEGMISRYLYGLDFPQRHFRNALVEASEGKVGTALDQVILYCFQYDPTANSYVLHAVNLMKLGGLLTVIVLGSFLFIFWRRERENLDEGVVARDAPALS